MKRRTSEDVLAESVRIVVDAEGLKRWIEGPLKGLLPHGAMLCWQSIPHSGGYAAIQTWGFGLPPAYEAAILCEGGNVRSPILARLIRSGGPEFFDIDLDRGADVDPSCRASFQLAGWRNLLGLAYLEGQGDGRVFTAAAFHDVGPEAAANRRALQRIVMPAMHVALSRIYQSARSHALALASTITPAEHAMLGLLLQGLTNKQIGQQLGKSSETIKRQVAVLMKRAGVSNRVELTRLVLSSAPELAGWYCGRIGAWRSN